jgi:hypothetical protein
MMSKESIVAAHKILQQASQLWSWQLPQPSEYGYTIILDSLKVQKPEVMKAAFEYLKKTYEDRNFPTFFQWRNAIKQAAPANNELSPKMALVKIADRSIRQYEKEAIELIKSWDEQQIVKQAKEENWYGHIWASYAVMPGGLAGYLYGIVLHQMKILNPDIDCPLTEPRELMKTDYLVWVKGSEFINRTLKYQSIDFLYRQSDLAKIKAYYLWAKNLALFKLAPITQIGA